MKQGLNEQLALLRYPQGTQICLGIGQRRLTNRELKELELVLLSHGVYLLDIVDVEEDPSKDKPLIDNMPHYRETMLLCRNIRSGQKLACRGNIVILGDVNPGAEVVAGGNIIVMGCLRGMAHAGALGDQNAVISAYRLRPTQLRIADHITRPPDNEVFTARNPELARIRDDRVVIEKLKI
ncbi:MAG: septum site-determining protein MinC [Syntrophomonadaceae bacterium]|nr:septum site-determining protein MinC [Syntrophomonadaceae bacterium]